MNGVRASWARAGSLEAIGALMVVAGFALLVRFFALKGYLPVPFIFDTNDTFMDWFHTAYWAHHGDAYSVWRTIYLPLSFVITGLFGDPRCYANSAFDARDCDQVGILFLLLTYIACVAATALVFRRHDRSTAMFRTIAIALGAPLLFALERGNTIMLAYVVFVLLYGGVVKNKAAVAVAGGFLINMKLYLLLPTLAFVIKRRWRTFELIGIASLALYLVSLAIVGEGTPFELVENIRLWFGSFAFSLWDQVVYSTTYSSYLLFDQLNYPLRDHIAQPTVDFAKQVIQVEVLASRAIALLCLALAWFYPRAVTLSRLVFFILVQSFISQNPGGYAILFVTFLIFLERRTSLAVGIAVACAYLSSIPADYVLAVVMEADRTSWLSGQTVRVDYAITLGALVRPGLLVIALWALAIDTLMAIHRAVKEDRPSLGLAPGFAAA